MTQLSKTAFKTTYSDSAGAFADNTTREISEADVRQFAEDIADSFETTTSTVGAITFKVVNIGDWNMDTTLDVPVAHGLADGNKIRILSIAILDDSGQLTINSGSTDVYSGGIDNTNVTIGRTPGGYYDSVLFDSTSYNRGYLTIGYEG